MIRQATVLLLLVSLARAADVLTVVVQGDANPSFYVPFVAGTFTDVPYGEFISGQLVVLANNLCDSSAPPTIGAASPFVLLVQRGGCDFTQKTVMASNLGAAALIVYDNSTADQPQVMRMGQPVDITNPNMPAVSITMAGGLKLQQIAAANPVVIVEISFTVLQAVRPQMQLILYQSDYTYNYVGNLSAALAGGLGSAIDMLPPIYKTVYHCQAPRCAAADCLTTNLDWCVKPMANQQLTGAQYVEQSVRQSLIFDKSEALWWAYMTEFQSKCLSVATFASCTPALMMAAVGFVQADIDAIEAKVQTELTNAKNDAASKLVTWRNYLRDNWIVDFQSVIINGVNYAGNGAVKLNSVLKMLCASFVTPAPAACSAYLSSAVNPRTANLTDINQKSIGLLTLNITAHWFNRE